MHGLDAGQGRSETLEWENIDISDLPTRVTRLGIAKTQRWDVGCECEMRLPREMQRASQR